jgi:hypothetical protein
MRGGVEVIVITDRQGRFVGAGTSNLRDSVNFPAAVIGRLDDPQAGFVMHHNHPAKEEPYFSETDIKGIRDHRGILFMLMHLKDGYSAIRTADRMFTPDASGLVPAAGIPEAYKKALSISNFIIHQKEPGLHPRDKEKIAAELALQAMQQAGAIEHYSSFKTGLGPQSEQEIIEIIRREAQESLARSGGGIWVAAKNSAPEGQPDKHPGITLPNPSTLEIGFDSFLDVLARQDVTSSRLATARSIQELPKSDRGGRVESVRPSRMPAHENKPKTPGN